ncbi:MAG: hypothetical protein JNN04_12310 [Cyclobacteriaceae bacterium]|nr:hypothetical protein [Cyclobacteriaceae bacterium]
MNLRTLITSLCLTIGIARPDVAFAQVSDLGIFAWNGAGWDKVLGGGIQIAVDGDGNPWIVNSAKDIYQFKKEGSEYRFYKLPGQANDIAVGGGKVWVIGTNPVGNGDFGVFSWNGKGWDQATGGGARIAVDGSGNPWIVNSINDIYQYSSPSKFTKLPGKAIDIAIGGGRVWVIGTNPVGNGDYGIFSWNGKGWDQAKGGGIRIGVDQNGNPWITNFVKEIYEFTSPTNFIKRPGQANDIAIGSGKVWVIGNDSPSISPDLTHDTYLKDFMAGNVVSIPVNIDCHFFEDDFRAFPSGGMEVDLTLISNRPFDVYYEHTVLVFFIGMDPVEHAQKQTIVENGTTYEAWVWHKKTEISGWGRAGLSSRSGAATFKLVRGPSRIHIDPQIPFDELQFLFAEIIELFKK